MRSVRSWSSRWRKRVPLSYVRTNLPDQRGRHPNQLTLNVSKSSPRVDYCNAVLRYADSQVDRLMRHRTTGWGGVVEDATSGDGLESWQPRRS